MTIESFGPGSVLVRQGEATQRLLLLASGTVSVFLGARLESRVVARLGRGAWIGETALLTGSVSSTTVIADTEVRALAISQEDFLSAAEDDPAIFRELARELAGRLRSADDLIERAPGQRLVALHHEPAQRAYVDQILAACARWAPVPHVGITLEGAARGTLTVVDYVTDRTRLSVLATRLKNTRTATVAAGAATDDDLSQFLGAIADLAGLVVVAGSHVPTATVGRLTDVVTLRSRSRSERELVPGVPHYRVGIDARFDVDRVARRICGQQVGLALGGGGARGFAHIGVIRALADAGIPIDVVTGTSIGAAVAAGLAAGRSIESIASSIESAGRGALMPSLPPLHGLFTAAFVERELKRQFGTADFEDLPLRFGAVAVDLLSGDEVLFTSGPLVPAVMASMAIPGIFAPVRHNGRVLVDGALRSPIPVRACREIGANIVIASHMRVAPPGAPPRTRALPWMPEAIVWALDVMQDHIATESVVSADIQVETIIPRERAGLFDFGHRREVEALGESAARGALASIAAPLLPTQRAAA